MFTSASGSQAPMVRQRARFTGPTWPKSPVVQGVPFNLKGTYTGLPGDTPLANGTARLYYSPDNQVWQSARGQARSGADGVIALAQHAWADGYWKLEVNSFGAEPVSVTSPLIKVRKRAWFPSFEASPELVRKGGKLKVSGGLANSYDGGQLRNRKVVIWFRSQGSKTWRKLAAVATNSHGAFSKTFKAGRDGYWRATYAGDTVYFSATSVSYHVDVR
jgi:hypothetical protein